MNKKVMKAAFVAAIAMVSGINVFNVQKSEVLSDMALANVEALANDENTDCSGGSGYRKWKTESWFGSEEEFYDCCNILRHGYSPSGNC